VAPRKAYAVLEELLGKEVRPPSLLPSPGPHPSLPSVPHRRRDGPTAKLLRGVSRAAVGMLMWFGVLLLRFSVRPVRRDTPRQPGPPPRSSLSVKHGCVVFLNCSHCQDCKNRCRRANHPPRRGGWSLGSGNGGGLSFVS